MDQVEIGEQENEIENDASEQSSSSNMNNRQINNEIFGKIKNKRKPIFKLTKRSNIRKKCTNYQIQGANLKRYQPEPINNQTSIKEQEGVILNPPENLSLEQSDTSINNNPSLNNLENDEIFSFDGSICQSPLFEQIKDSKKNNNFNTQIPDIKDKQEIQASNQICFSNLNFQNLSISEQNKEQSQNNHPTKVKNLKHILSTKNDEKQKLKKLNAHKQIVKQAFSHTKKGNNIHNQLQDFHNIEQNELSDSPFDTESIQNNTLNLQNNQTNNGQNEKDRDISPSQKEDIIHQSSFNNPDKCDGNKQHLQYSRKEKSLEELSKKFLSLFLQKEQMMISLDKITQQLDVERRRIYDIINILESLNLVTRRGKNNYKWNGFEQVFDTIQHVSILYNQTQQKQKIFQKFNSQSQQNEAADACSTTEQNEKKEKSLEILSIGFLKLFLNYKQTLSLEEAAKKLSPSNSENQKIKTKIRRLYDIANVFKSLGLIKKVQLNETKKPAFQWVGISGLQDFYNSSKDKEEIQVNVEMEETKKNNKVQKKEQVIKQKSLTKNSIEEIIQFEIQQQNSNKDLSPEQNNQCSQFGDIQKQLGIQLQNQKRKSEDYLPQSNIDLIQDSKSKIKSQNCSGFLSNSKNSAFKRVSKSLTDSTSFNNSSLKQIKLDISDQSIQEQSITPFTDAQYQIKCNLDQINQKEKFINSEKHENDIEQQQQKQKQTNKTTHDMININEEIELISLLEKMRLQNLITESNENLTNTLKQNTFSFNSSLKNMKDEKKCSINKLDILNENVGYDNNKLILQLAQQTVSKVAKDIQNQKLVQTSQNSSINQTNSKLNQDKYNSYENNNNSNTLFSLFDQLNITRKSENINTLQLQNSIFDLCHLNKIKQEQITDNKSDTEMILEYLGDEQKANSLIQTNQLSKFSSLENAVRNQLIKNIQFNSQNQIEQNLITKQQNFNQIFGLQCDQTSYLQLENIKQQYSINETSINSLNKNLKQKLQFTSRENQKKEVNMKKKQKKSLDNNNSKMSNDSLNSFYKENHNQQQISSKKEKFKTKSNSLYEDNKILSELKELVKQNREADQLFFSPNKELQCIKKLKKGQEEIISTSVSSNQSSDSKIQQIPIGIVSESAQLSRIPQLQEQQNKAFNFPLQQQSMLFQSTLISQNIMKSIIN